MSAEPSQLHRFLRAPNAQIIHCRCGLPLSLTGPPFRCARGHEEWFSPAPVAVVVLHVQGLIVLVQRAIPPKIGEWCLPGGFVQRGETFAAAGSREFFEETGVFIPATDLTLFHEAAVTEAGVNLVFLRALWPEHAPLPAFSRDHESLAVMTCSPHALPSPMAFPTHVDAIMRATQHA